MTGVSGVLDGSPLPVGTVESRGDCDRLQETPCGQTLRSEAVTRNAGLTSTIIGREALRCINLLGIFISLLI